MLDFDEEIKKFQPSLEVEDAEDAIYNNDVPDITDLITKIIMIITRTLSTINKTNFGPKHIMVYGERKRWIMKENNGYLMNLLLSLLILMKTLIIIPRILVTPVKNCK